MGVTPAVDERELAMLYDRMNGKDPGILLHYGTERPVPRPVDTEAQQEKYSGKKKTHTVRNGVIATFLGAILFVSQTVCGKVHDKTVADRFHTFPVTSMVFQDTGYQGYSGKWTTCQPFRKPKGRELEEHRKDWNRTVSSYRVRIENFIGSAKIMRMVKDECRVRKG